jgi:hypothetical protein
MSWQRSTSHNKPGEFETLCAYPNYSATTSIPGAVAGLRNPYPGGFFGARFEKQPQRRKESKEKSKIDPSSAYLRVFVVNCLCGEF